MIFFQINYSSLALPLIFFLGILAATFFVSAFIGAILTRILSRSTPLVVSETKRVARAFVWIGGVLLAVEQLGLRVDFLYVLVAAGGFAVIIGSRDSLENIFARYFSELYVPVRIGDYITVRGHSGRVIEMNPISTILLSADDQLVSIPNSIFIKEAVINATPQAWKELTIPIVVGGDVNLPEFERAILKSCNKLKLRLDERFPPLLSVKSRSSQSAELSLTLMVKEPGNKEEISAELNQRITSLIEETKRKGSPP
jgi:small conductance mechanosensitive channel